jgi:hypothetical protein
VRKYLDNPESARRLPEREQHGMIERLKAAMFERTTGTPTPRRGPSSSSSPSRARASSSRAARSANAEAGDRTARDPRFRRRQVNNAQKAGLVYLKVNYPVVQGSRTSR